jgi:hypothetical protein
MSRHPPLIVSKNPSRSPRGLRGCSTGSCAGPPVALIERASPSGQGHLSGPYHRQRLQRAPFGPKGREVEPSEGKRQVGSFNWFRLAAPSRNRTRGGPSANGSPAKKAVGMRRLRQTVAFWMSPDPRRAALNFAARPPRVPFLDSVSHDFWGLTLRLASVRAIATALAEMRGRRRSRSEIQRSPPSISRSRSATNRPDRRSNPTAPFGGRAIRGATSAGPASPSTMSEDERSDRYLA